MVPVPVQCGVGGEEREYEPQLQGLSAGAVPLHPQQGAVPAVLQTPHQPGTHMHQVHRTH